MAGTIRRVDAPGYLMATVETLDDALLSVYCEPAGAAGKGLVTVIWNLYGPAVARQGELRRRWEGLLDSLFGPPVKADGAATP